MTTLQCALGNGADLFMSVRRYDTIALGLLKKEEECQFAMFYFDRCVRKLRYYSDVLHSFDWKSVRT